MSAAEDLVGPLGSASIRADFPILERTVRDGVPLVYLDSAATSQRPVSVIDAEQDFVTGHYAAVGRSSHQLATDATVRYEAARATVAEFVGAARPEEIVFTAGATAALNTLAYSFGNAAFGDEAAARFRLAPGDEIVVTELEHHANLVPWQQLAARTGAIVRYVPLGDDFRLDVTDVDEIVNRRTRIVAFSAESNVLGTIPPLDRMLAAAGRVGALTVLDACQAVPHRPINVSELGVDFAAFSGHKMLGPTGIGALYGRYDLLAALPPFLTGGSMIETVYMDRSTFLPPPARFEAGTPPVTQAVALAAAADYLTELGMAAVERHTLDLAGRALAGLAAIPGVTIFGPSDLTDRGPAVAFLVDGVHPHDVGQVLDAAGVEVRVGHHCAWPLHRRYGVPASTRASFHVYSNQDDVDALIDAVRSATAFFAGR